MSQCRVKLTCRTCGKKHNSLLHWRPRSDALVFGSDGAISDSGVEAFGSNYESMICAAGAKEQPSAQEEGPAIFKVLPVKV